VVVEHRTGEACVPVFEFGSDGITEIKKIGFDDAGIKERADLQRLLREKIGVIAPGTMIISEEFGDWQDSRRRIDLLGIDKAANLVVIELKRTDDGGHMELQAIRYAAMVARMTFDQAVDTYRKHLRRLGPDGEDPESLILKFLDWETPNDGLFARSVCIVLAAADFSREITSTVLWLNERNLDVRCVRLTPYAVGERILVDVQQVIPLPEMSDYLIRIREKAEKVREDQVATMDFTRFDVKVGEQSYPNLTKRAAFLRVCRYLCAKGVNSENIAGIGPRVARRVIFGVEGDCDAAEFLTRAAERASSEPGAPGFGPRRWFCADDDLVKTNGKTYAFSNQWGGDRWRETMNRLCAAYPEDKIALTEAG
jgi:hypothetical protein